MFMTIWPIANEFTPDEIKLLELIKVFVAKS